MSAAVFPCCGTRQRNIIQEGRCTVTRCCAYTVGDVAGGASLQQRGHRGCDTPMRCPHKRRPAGLPHAHETKRTG
jgi:hypothetical protein